MATKPTDPTKYKAVRGLSFPPGGRVEPGKRLPASFPEKSLPWLLRDGDIEPAKKGD